MDTQPEPQRLKRVVIKEEFVHLLGGHIEALILNQFLYWSERTADFDKFIEEERRRNPKLDLEPTYGWVYKSSEELSEEIMIKASPATMRRHIAKLVKAGYLEERHNPKHQWDRCLQYRPNTRKIQDDLQALGYSLEGYSLFSKDAFFKIKNAFSKTENQLSDLKNRTIENEKAIPEIPSETPSESREKPENIEPDLKNVTPPPPPSYSNNSTPDPRLRFQPLPSAIAEICKWNLKTMTRKQGITLKESTETLMAVGATPEKIKLFETWWYKYDWRGTKNPPEPPTPAQVCEEWGKFEAYLLQPNGVNGNGNGKKTTLTEEQRKRYEAMRAEEAT